MTYWGLYDEKAKRWGTNNDIPIHVPLRSIAEEILASWRKVDDGWEKATGRRSFDNFVVTFWPEDE